jgi:hypothetical protein
MDKFEIIVPGADRMIRIEREQQYQVTLPGGQIARSNSRDIHPIHYRNGTVAQRVRCMEEQDHWSELFRTDIDILLSFLQNRSNVPGWQKALLQAAAREIGEFGVKTEGFRNYQVRAYRVTCPKHPDVFLQNRNTGSKATTGFKAMMESEGYAFCHECSDFHNPNTNS